MLVALTESDEEKKPEYEIQLSKSTIYRGFKSKTVFSARKIATK